MAPIKKQYKTSFNDGWVKMEEYKDWVLKIDQHTAKCRICGNSFAVHFLGVKALKDHKKTQKHGRIYKQMTTNRCMATFTTSSNATEKNKIAAAELAAVYHGCIRTCMTSVTIFSKRMFKPDSKYC
jgi:hypothetical protein